MTLGELPRSAKGLASVQRASYAFRRQLEASVAERASGRMATLYEVALIDVATRHHRNVMLAHRWLAESLGKLTVADKMRFAELAATFAEKRNATLAKLGLADDRGGGGDPYDEAMAELRARGNGSGNLFAPHGRASTPEADREPGEDGDA